jgi:hypothetical protein
LFIRDNFLSLQKNQTEQDYGTELSRIQSQSLRFIQETSLEQRFRYLYSVLFQSADTETKDTGLYLLEEK